MPVPATKPKLQAVQTTPSLTIARCDPASHKLVLALAAQAWAENERAVHWQVLGDVIRQGRGSDVVLLGAWQGEQLVAALLGQMMAGRTAVVWLPQFAQGDELNSGRVVEALFAQLSEELRARGVHLAQALTPSGDEQAAVLFNQGDFQHAADLLYLAAEPESFPDHPINLPFTLEEYSPSAAARLVQLIDRTYKGTLDCPLMDALRDTPDVVEGYQAVGEFRPELWQLARDGAEDIGCVLVNLHPDTKAAEIVYLGLVPEVRGRSWGLELTRHAQWLAREAGCERIMLAVDAANEPAIRMYAAAGFSQWDRKEVWLRSLR